MTVEDERRELVSFIERQRVLLRQHLEERGDLIATGRTDSVRYHLVERQIAHHQTQIAAGQVYLAELNRAVR